MKKLVCFFTILSMALFLITGISHAVMGVDDKTPAQRLLVIGYFNNNSMSGENTEIDIINLGSNPITVHWAIYNNVSAHILDDSFTMSSLDCIHFDVRAMAPNTETFLDANGDGISEFYIIFDVVREATHQYATQIVGVAPEYNQDLAAGFPFPITPTNVLTATARIVDIRSGYSTELPVYHIESDAMGGFETPICGPVPIGGGTTTISQWVWVPYRSNPTYPSSKSVIVVWLESATTAGGRTIPIDVFDSDENTYSSLMDLSKELNFISLPEGISGQIGTGTFVSGFIRFYMPDDGAVFVIQKADDAFMQVTFPATHSTPDINLYKYGDSY
ncbi:MAG: hypothetical protein DRG20_02215 [Deltaproteobacteria bacterium]|nr:hypothetical protein [Deltaproteobacteria bacterium]RLA91168.1 MAG: hypothetical protein DRG20_02215 [Deltaproteobacteria bacterium]